MSRTRYKAKTDANQASLVEAFRVWGWSVCELHTVGKGCPDLCVAGTLRAAPFTAVTALVEIKAAAGTFTPHQIEFISAWRGPVYVARTPEDVRKLVHGELPPVDLSSGRCIM